MSDALLPITLDTSVVSFTIKVDGEEVSSSLPVHSIAVHCEVNRIPSATICINDGDAAEADWTISNDSLFVPGNEIEILAGYHGTVETIFKGIVTRQSLVVRENHTELNVECRHKAVLMTIVRNSNLFEDVKDSDIAS